MAEPRDDQPTGRMLFTDFDASDKGRPTIDLRQIRNDPRQESRFRGGVTRTLDDLASSLDFDFEEDDDQPASPPTPRRSTARKSLPRSADGHGGETDANGVTHPLPDDAEPWDDGLPAPNDSAQHRSNPVPTWKEYAGAFINSPNKQPLETDATENPSVYSTSLDDHDSRAEPDVPPPASSRESGRADTGDEEDIDILSLLSSNEEEGTVHASFEEDWRGRRLGVGPPRATPYGGIERVEEWYRPPENAGDDAMTADPDWYDPPEEKISPGAAANGKTRRHEVSASPLNIDAGEKRRSENHASSGGKTRGESNVTQTIDIFSGIDVDALWNKKVEEREIGPAETTMAGRDFDFLEDDELEKAWERNRSRTPAAQSSGASALGETTIFRPEAFDNASTVILSPEELRQRELSVDKPTGNESTVILSQEELFRNTSPPPSIAEKRAPRSAARSFTELRREKDPPEGKKETGTANAPRGPDEPPDGAPGDEAPGADINPAPEGTASARNKSSRNDGTDTFDLDELMAMTDIDGPAVNDAVVAPLVGDDDIAVLRKKRSETTGGGADAAEPSEDPSQDEPERIKAPIPEHDEAYLPNDADSHDPGPGAPTAAHSDDAAPIAPGGEETAAVNPMDVFANMDDMDFSGDGGLDDEMKAMLDDEAAGQKEADGSNPADDEKTAPPDEEKIPEGISGKVRWLVKAALQKVLRQPLLNRIMAMIAWKENWWFYCDLLAAIVASASLAIIISYYVWYRN